MEKKFKGAPFGVQTARFDVSGIYPQSKMPGTFTEISFDRKSTSSLQRKMAPGAYHIDQGGFSTRAVEERASGPGWSRQIEVERMAALPHLLHKDQWQERKTLQNKLGPGSYNIKDFLKVSEEKPRSIRGICDARSHRFPDKDAYTTPGPGTYGKGGVPHRLLEEKNMKSASTKGMLESGGGPRTLPMTGSYLGPGTYNFRSFSDEFIAKMTSTRGPYDLFSGDRNKPISEGHFAAPRLANLGPGQYDISSFLDEWDREHKIHKGKFGIVAQYPMPPVERIYNSTLSQYPRTSSAPGPGQYQPQELTKPVIKDPPGFLSSADRFDRRSQKGRNPVGVGRYDVQKFDEAQHRNGHQSVFKSKTGKHTLRFDKFLKERIRGKDIPPAQRSFLTNAQGLPCTEIPHHLYTFNQRALTVV